MFEEGLEHSPKTSRERGRSGTRGGTAVAGTYDASARRVAWTTLSVVSLLFVGGLILSVLNRALDPIGLAFFLFPLVGAPIASRQPRNAIGWILLAIGLTWGVYGVLSGYAHYALVTEPGALPRPDLVLALNSWTWLPAVGLMAIFLLLLFPDGRLQSPRWRPLAWLSAATLIFGSVTTIVLPRRFENEGFPGVVNPLGIEALAPVRGFIEGLTIISLLACIAASALSAVLRFRRSRGVERLQMKWLALGASITALMYLAAMVTGAVLHLSDARATPLWAAVLEPVAVASFVLIPIAIGIAILRYRLYDIDVVINKTVVYGTLAVFIGGVYVAVVAGLGALLGSRGEPNTALSILATALVALAFQPVRARVQRVANRLVYGQRATPYEMLARFSESLTTLGAEELLPHTAATLRDATGAARADVWLRTDARLTLGASAPAQDARPKPVRLVDGTLPALPGDAAAPIHHRGELLGALALTKGRGDPLTPRDHQLLGDLAAQAGEVVRNAALTADLQARLAELSAHADEIRRSRARIVAAQDDERRSLERNIHDGAQQHLVALAVKLKLAKTLSTRAPDKAATVITQLRAEVAATVTALRQLAAGVYPAVLEERGLVAALRAQLDGGPLEVELAADGVGRYPRDTEATVYFCCLEALQNVAKYSGASRAEVTLQDLGAQLTFSVRDHGAGFDPATTRPGSGLANMTDRMAAAGGSIEVESSPGAGTTVTGRLPMRQPEVVA